MDAQVWDRISESYFEEISTPFQAEVVNPLLDYLDGLPGRENLTVADLGCGIGNLLPFLAGRFKTVVAVDFSPKMLSAAQENCACDNVQFCRQSLTDLSVFQGQFDVAVTVNSVLAPSLDVVDQILRGVAGTLKPAGILAGIFPSMESVLHEGGLILDWERQRSENEQQARCAARREKQKRVATTSLQGSIPRAKTARNSTIPSNCVAACRKQAFEGCSSAKSFIPGTKKMATFDSPANPDYGIGLCGRLCPLRGQIRASGYCRLPSSLLKNAHNRFEESSIFPFTEWCQGPS